MSGIAFAYRVSFSFRSDLWGRRRRLTSTAASWHVLLMFTMPDYTEPTSHDIGVSEAYVCRYTLSHISADAYNSISRRSYQLIEVLPVVLRHQTERTQQRPRKVVEISISVVGIWTSDDAVITRRTFPTRIHVGRNKNTAFSQLIFQLFSSHNKK